METMRVETVEKRSNASSVRVPARAPRWTVPLVKSLLAVTDIALALLFYGGISGGVFLVAAESVE